MLLLKLHQIMVRHVGVEGLGLDSLLNYLTLLGWLEKPACFQSFAVFFTITDLTILLFV